jgi:hypothetical protein
MDHIRHDLTPCPGRRLYDDVEHASYKTCVRQQRAIENICCPSWVQMASCISGNKRLNSIQWHTINIQLWNLYHPHQQSCQSPHTQIPAVQQPVCPLAESWEICQQPRTPSPYQPHIDIKYTECRLGQHQHRTPHSQSRAPSRAALLNHTSQHGGLDFLHHLSDNHHGLDAGLPQEPWHHPVSFCVCPSSQSLQLAAGCLDGGRYLRCVCRVNSASIENDTARFAFTQAVSGEGVKGVQGKVGLLSGHAVNDSFQLIRQLDTHVLFFLPW